LILLRAAGRNGNSFYFRLNPHGKITGIFPTDYGRACILNAGRVCRMQIKPAGCR
jgi:hypothetical protein